MPSQAASAPIVGASTRKASSIFYGRRPRAGSRSRGDLLRSAANEKAKGPSGKARGRPGKAGDPDGKPGNPNTKAQDRPGNAQAQQDGDGKAEDRRERLVDSAVRLFSKRPYEEVSVQDIAADAGVAIGLLYYHFADKQGLYVAGLERLAGEMRTRVKAASQDPAHESALERLMAGLKAQLEFVEEHPTIFRDLGSLAAHPQIDGVIEREREERLKLAVAALPKGVKTARPAMATVEGWLHFVDGVQVTWLSHRTLTAEEVCELSCHVLFASVQSAIEFDKKRTRKRAAAKGSATKRARARKGGGTKSPRGRKSGVSEKKRPSK